MNKRDRRDLRIVQRLHGCPPFGAPYCAVCGGPVRHRKPRGGKARHMRAECVTDPGHEVRDDGTLWAQAGERLRSGVNPLKYRPWWTAFRYTPFRIVWWAP